MFTQLREYFGKMSRGNKIRMAILSVVVVALAIITVILLTRTKYATLYIAQDQAEAGRIQAALREMNVPAKIEGTRIQVPEGRVSELQAELASQGTIGARGTDLSIMSGAAGFSVTESHAMKLYEAQSAEEIRTAILASPKIQNAYVIVNYGETSPFIKPQNSKQATCSVMLILKRDASLTNKEAQSIAEHVRTAIQGISYENITITDENLKHYKIGEDEEEDVDKGTEMNSLIELQTKLTEQTKVAGEQLLIPVFGQSNVQVTPTIRLSFDKVVKESVEFAPPVAGELDGIVRSSSDLWEAQRRDEAAEGVPGTDTNGMGTVEYPYGSLEDDESYRRSVLEKNYEINETRTSIEQQGKIEYLSVAVAINESAVNEDDVGKVANLVSAGLGITPDHVSVERVPFFEDPSIEAEIKAKEELEARQRQKDLVETIIKWAVILLLGLAFMMLIRIIVKAVKPPPEPEPVLVDGGFGINYIADDYNNDAVIVEDTAVDDITDVTEYDEVELQKKSTGLEQIEKFIDKDPGAVAQLLRNWLTDEE